jgi:hypothetical protein
MKLRMRSIRSDVIGHGKKPIAARGNRFGGPSTGPRHAFI